jgi:Zn finger protein HypA/HybF involved in hydrogenase expression
MAATTDRQAAHGRLMALAKAQVDRLIPLDESVPLEGQSFADFEDQADELERALCPAFLKERVALSNAATHTTGGRCPHCHSDRVHLEPGRVSEVDLITPHGNVQMTKQKARCRSCDRTFSPSGS